MYDGAGAFSAPAIWNLNSMRFNHCVSQKTEPWPWQLNPKEVAPRFSFAWDSICCMNDQIWFAASVALKTFVQFQFRFQSLTSRSLTGTLGFNLVKCWSRFHNENDHFTPLRLPKHKVHRWKNHQKVTPKSPPKIFPSVHAPPWSSLVQCWNRSYKQLVLRWLCSMWCDFLWDLFQIALTLLRSLYLFVVEKLWCCSWFNVSRPHTISAFLKQCVANDQRRDVMNRRNVATPDVICGRWLESVDCRRRKLLSGYRPPFHQPENG